MVYPLGLDSTNLTNKVAFGGTTNPQQIVAPNAPYWINNSVQTDSFVSTKDVKYENKKTSKSSVLAGVAVGLASVGLAIMAGPRAIYHLRNMGKKGVTNFLKGNADDSLKKVITSISENSEIKSKLDKLGVKNIKVLAKQLKENVTLVDLVKGDAICRAGIIGQEGMSKMPQVISFADKDGYKFLKELDKADDVSRTMKRLLIETKEHVRKTGREATIVSGNKYAKQLIEQQGDRASSFFVFKDGRFDEFGAVYKKGEFSDKFGYIYGKGASFDEEHALIKGLTEDGCYWYSKAWNLLENLRIDSAKAPNAEYAICLEMPCKFV